jgi:hypothetical protein
MTEHKACDQSAPIMNFNFKGQFESGRGGFRVKNGILDLTEAVFDFNGQF